MLSERLLLRDRRGDHVIPRFLGAGDLPWIERVVDEHDRFVGRPRADLYRRLSEPDPSLGPPRKRQLVGRVLAGYFAAERDLSPRPRELRAFLFEHAAGSSAPREASLAAAAAHFGIEPGQVEARLFADLGDLRPVGSPEGRPAAADVVLEGNLLLAQGLLFRASQVRIDLLGNARPVVRHAQLRGLLCEARQQAESCVLRISGPFSVFRHTLVYGRALASLLPALPWCRRASLVADLCLPDGPGWMRLDESAPIFPSAAPRRFDSLVEERFARDFGRLAPAWEIVREPDAIAVPGGGLLFPDFLLRDRRAPGRAWHVEIVSFWTPDYLRRKLAAYRAASVPDLLLCVDAARNLSPADLPPDARVLRYGKRVDAAAVLAVIEGARVQASGAHDGEEA